MQKLFLPCTVTATIRWSNTPASFLFVPQYCSRNLIALVKHKIVTRISSQKYSNCWAKKNKKKIFFVFFGTQKWKKEEKMVLGPKRKNGACSPSPLPTAVRFREKLFWRIMQLWMGQMPFRSCNLFLFRNYSLF